MVVVCGHPNAGVRASPIALGRRCIAYVQRPHRLGVSNAGLVVCGSREPVLIDTLLTPSMIAGLIATAVCRGVGWPRVVVNTHGHVDHVGGNALLCGARFVGPRGLTARLRELYRYRGRLAAMMPAWAREINDMPRLPPGDLIEIGGEAWFGSEDERLHLVAFLGAHSPCDLVVHVPDDGVLFAGDLAFFGVTPLLLPSADLDGWIDALRRIAGIPVRWVVPGHGAVGTLEQLAETRVYLESLRAHAVRGLQAGAPEDAVVSAFEASNRRGWALPGRSRANVGVALRYYGQSRVGTDLAQRAVRSPPSVLTGGG